jgi:hypothetical protein
VEGFDETREWLERASTPCGIFSECHPERSEGSMYYKAAQIKYIDSSFAALSQNDTSKDHCAIHRDATPMEGFDEPAD